MSPRITAEVARARARVLAEAYEFIQVWEPSDGDAAEMREAPFVTKVILRELHRWERIAEHLER